MSGPELPPPPPPRRVDEDLIGHMERRPRGRRRRAPAAGIVSALLPGATLPTYSKAVSAGLTAAAGCVATAQAAGDLNAGALTFIALTSLGAAFAALATKNAPPPHPGVGAPEPEGDTT